MSETIQYQPVRAPRDTRLTIRGLEHRVLRWGPPSQQPIVMLHGWMDVAETWQFLVDALPEDWPLAALDWRGFGKSANSVGEYWFPDYLADLDALLDELCPGAPARVIAHSMGANIAMLYAGVRTERLEWLANLEGVGLPPTTPDEAPQRYLRWLDQLREPVRATGTARPEAMTIALMRRNPRLPEDRARYLAQALAADPRHRRVNPVLYRRAEAEACWSRIKTPVLLVRGARSEASSMPTEPLHVAASVMIPDAGHSMHLEDPAGVARAIVEFAYTHSRGP